MKKQYLLLAILGCLLSSICSHSSSIQDGLFVSSSILSNPLISMSPLEESGLSLSTRHKDRVMNRNYVFIRTHPHYSLFLPPTSYTSSHLTDWAMLNPLTHTINPSWLSSILPTTNILGNSGLAGTFPSLSHLFDRSIRINPLQQLQPPSPLSSAAASMFPSIGGGVGLTHQPPYPNHQQTKQVKYQQNKLGSKPKIEIGQKLSNSAYANSQNLRYEMPTKKQLSGSASTLDENYQKTFYSPDYLNDSDNGHKKQNDEENLDNSSLSLKKPKASKEEVGFF